MKKAEKYLIDIPEDVQKALGRVVAQWAHLDETLSTQLRILLGECDAAAIKIPTHLKIPGSDRLRLYRSVAAHLFTKEGAEATNRALDQVANVRPYRERLIHGNITPQDDGRLLVHYAEEKRTGGLAAENHWYTVDRINVIADRMAEADHALGTGFRSYFARKHSPKGA
jgi:hypothetical protein